MRGGLWGLAILILAAGVIGSAAPAAAGPEPAAALETRTIRVDSGTSVTIYERTTDLNVLTYSVATLMGPGGTFRSLAFEEYTFTSDGESVRISCFRNSWGSGGSTGNNIAAVRLDGVPGYPMGIWATVVLNYTLGYGGLADSRFNATGDNLADITYMGDQSSELVLGFTEEVQGNSGPAVTSFLATPTFEGGEVVFTVSAADLDGDDLTYSFDFESDGVFDEIGTSPTASRTYGDDFAGLATVRVSDGANTTDATAAVTVGNLRPAVVGRVTGTVTAVATLRVAGETWEEVYLSYKDDTSSRLLASLRRDPGSPGEQGVKVPRIAVDVLAEGGAMVVEYRGRADPLPGFAPGADRVTLEFEDRDGHLARVHHTFRSRHPETWTWRIPEFPTYLRDFPVDFAARVLDPGSDDVAFRWVWGDGTESDAGISYADGHGPDPYPSPTVGPRNLLVTGRHRFESTDVRSVRLELMDDDGGNQEVTVNFRMAAAPADLPVDVNWKPFVAGVFAAFLAVAGVVASRRNPWGGRRTVGSVAKAFVLLSLPFVAAEALTGVVSHATGYLAIPPVVGFGTAVDLGILLSGLAAAVHRLRSPAGGPRGGRSAPA